MTRLPDLNKTALVVLGMHRSGTSAMAASLAMCGAELPKLMLQANFANRKGYFEPALITELNDELLAHVDSDWDAISAGHPKEHLSNFNHFYLNKALDLIRQTYPETSVIVLKDPRINVLVKFWERVLGADGYRPLYVTMVRHPLEVAFSLRERDGFPLEKSLLLWLENMLAAERDTRGLPRIYVNYDDLLDNWSNVFSRIEHRLGVPLPRRTPASANEVDLHLSHAERHYHFKASTAPDDSQAYQTCLTAHRWFVAAAHDQDLDDALLLNARGWLDTLHGTIDPILADARTQAKRLQLDVDEQRTAAVRAHQSRESAEVIASANEQLAASAKAEHSAALQNLAQLREAYERMQADHRTITEAAASQLQERLTLHDRIAELTTSGDDARTTSALVGEALSRSRAELSEATAEHEGALQELAQLHEAHERMQADHRAVTEASAVQLQERLELQDRIAQLTTSGDDARTTLASVGEALSRSEAKLSKVTAEYEGALQELAQLHEAHERVQAEHRAVTEASALQLQERLKLHDTIAQLTTSENDARNRLASVGEALSGSEAKLHKVTAEHEGALQELAQLHEAYERVQADHRAVTEASAVQLQERLNLHDTIAQLTTSEDDARIEVTLINEQLSQSRADLSAATDSAEALQRALKLSRAGADSERKAQTQRISSLRLELNLASAVQDRALEGQRRAVDEHQRIASFLDQEREQHILVRSSANMLAGERHLSELRLARALDELSRAKASGVSTEATNADRLVRLAHRIVRWFSRFRAS